MKSSKQTVTSFIIRGTLMFRLIVLFILTLSLGCSQISNVAENEMTPFSFHFPEGNFFTEDVNNVGGATISEKELIISEEPGDAYKERNILGPELDIELTGITLFTGEGSYLRFVGSFSRDYLNFTVNTIGTNPLCFRKKNDAWCYLSGEGTVTIDGKQYDLGAKRDKTWFMNNLSAEDDISKEKAIRDLARYPGFLNDHSITKKLIELLNDKSAFVRRSAAIQIGRSNITEGSNYLEKISSEEKDENAYYAMKEAIQRLGVNKK
jgi:hypothetical protein